MYSYAATDVNQALQFGLEHLFHEGVEEQSRNGPVLVAPGPVCVEYTNPRQRVLYSSTRDANPFFHLLEALWMLSGSNNIEFPCYFNKPYSQFSDDGATMWDAYGWRWRKFFGYDQLDALASELRSSPTSRRCVLSMWNSFAQAQHKSPVPSTGPWSEDLYIATHGGKAVPCNTHAYFAVRAGKLNMTVMNRSNDAIWGSFGANAVHFSLLLEYMSMRAGLPMGSYYQFTNNLHVYTARDSREKLEAIAYECVALEDLPTPTPEVGPTLEPGFDEDLAKFMPWALELTREPDGGATSKALNVPQLATPFMHSVVVPMFLCWVYRKWKDDYSMNVCLDGIQAPDWQLACREWIERRQK